jgi:hypothetical protein
VLAATSYPIFKLRKRAQRTQKIGFRFAIFAALLRQSFFCAGQFSMGCRITLAISQRAAQA